MRAFLQYYISTDSGLSHQENVISYSKAVLMYVVTFLQPIVDQYLKKADL